MQPLRERVYNLGDVGYVLCAKHTNQPGMGMYPLIEVRRRAANDWTVLGGSLVLAETIITGVDGAADPEEDTARTLSIATQGDGDWRYRHFEIDRTSVGRTLENGGNNVLHLLPGDDSREKRAFLYNFLYPVVVSGRGYIEMLKDIAVASGRQGAEVQQKHLTSTQDILRKAAEFGIPVVELNYTNKTDVKLVREEDHQRIEQIDTAVKRAFIGG